MTAALLRVKNLHITAGATTLVDNLSFHVNPGETLALVGESGSGKTLTALSIMGLLPHGLQHRATTLHLGNHNLQTLPPAGLRHLRGKQMAMIFQEPATALNPVMTCGAQVAEMFQIHTPHLSKTARQEKVLALFEQVQLPQPARILSSYPHEISGGQRQRVMIAMALAHRPALLIADEPTTALDVTVQAEILALVKGLQQQLGMAMLWITHDFGVVRQLADRVAVLQHGRLVEHGPAATLLARPKAAYTKQLLAATLQLNNTPPALPKAAKPLLLAENLGHTYRRPAPWFWQPAEQLCALAQVSFTLPQGTTLGVVGESGSGKSTLARVLTRLQPPTHGGKIVFLGQDFLALRAEPLRQARREMQMVFQDPVTSLNPALDIFTTLTEPIRAHSLLPPAQWPARVAELLQQVGLPPEAAQRYPHQFSGGQRQRIAIARALALQPKLIIADEPVSALDVSIQAQILDLFLTLQKTLGTSYVFISHDLRVISHLAHQVLVLKDGKVAEYGPTAQVFGKPKAAYTKQLLRAVI
jgi:ABC-type microcin C transport system duplicated ATPase subunit YejF